MTSSTTRQTATVMGTHVKRPAILSDVTAGGTLLIPFEPTVPKITTSARNRTLFNPEKPFASCCDLVASQKSMPHYLYLNNCPMAIHNNTEGSSCSNIALVLNIYISHPNLHLSTKCTLKITDFVFLAIL